MSLLRYCFVLLFVVSVNSQTLLDQPNTGFENDLIFGAIKNKLELDIDFDNKIIRGKQWLNVSPLFYDQNRITLDAKNMEILNVSVFGKKVKYNYYKDKIYIDFDKPYSKDDSIDIYIEYTTTKKNTESKKGIKFTDLDKNKGGFKFISNQQPSDGSWFVTLDKVGHRSSQELSIRYPSKYKSVSNGSLTSSIVNDDGTKTDHWIMNENAPVSSMFLGIGEFEMKSETHNNLTVNYFYSSKSYQKKQQA